MQSLISIQNLKRFPKLSPSQRYTLKTMCVLKRPRDSAITAPRMMLLFFLVSFPFADSAQAQELVIHSYELSLSVLHHVRCHLMSGNYNP